MSFEQMLYMSLFLARRNIVIVVHLSEEHCDRSSTAVVRCAHAYYFNTDAITCDISGKAWCLGHDALVLPWKCWVVFLTCCLSLKSLWNPSLFCCRWKQNQKKKKVCLKAFKNNPVQEMIRAEMISCCGHGRFIWISAFGRECSYGPGRAWAGSLWDFVADANGV